MKAALLYFFSWWFSVPWCASTVYFFSAGHPTPSSLLQNPVGAVFLISFSALYALFGVLFCLVFTIPASVAVWMLFAFCGTSLDRSTSSVIFHLTLGLIGAAIGHAAAIFMSLHKVEISLIGPGFLAGIALAQISLLCLRRAFRKSI